MNQIEFSSNILIKSRKIPFTFLSIIVRLYKIGLFDECPLQLHSTYYLNCQSFADVLGNVCLNDCSFKLNVALIGYLQRKPEHGLNDFWFRRLHREGLIHLGINPFSTFVLVVETEIYCSLERL